MSLRGKVFLPRLSPDIIGIVGPTGIGKSAVALQIARRIPCEIVSVDSMQVYRRMDLGTGKPSAALRREIPHHGLDLVEPGEEFNVARYLQAVCPVLPQIAKRSRLCLLVGGTGLYLKRFLDGLCPAPPASLSVREELFEQARQEGAQVLHDELRRVDPASAEKIHPNDVKKMVRALEVFRLTKRPMSDWHRQTQPLLSKGSTVHLFGLTCDRAGLSRRIEERVDRWLAQGWLAEAQRLRKRRLSKTAREALGYGELFDFLEGKADWEVTVQLIKQRTRQYAKRQWTWFKADPRVIWISVDGRRMEEVAEEILNQTYQAPATMGARLKPGTFD